MNVRRSNKIVALAAVGMAGAMALSACGGDGGGKAVGSESPAAGGKSSSDLSGKIAGAGASSTEAAQGSWTQNFGAQNSGATVTYAAVGSGKGREQFLNGGAAFAGSDDAMKTDEIKESSKTCQGGKAFDVPIYISPIAVVYKLDGVKDLQLSPKTLAGIFAGKITKWDDPAIKADNPDAKLPSKAIVPVHRSDKSGTTGNFTDYLAQNAPDAWTAGKVEEWPTQGGQSGDGTSGLISTVQGGDGTIGYADASKAGNLGVAKIKVGDGFVAPNEKGAATAVENSPRDTEGRESNDIVVKVDRKQTKDEAYPLVLVSYMVMCDTYKDAKTADLVKAYANYIVSEQGQKAGAEAAGSAPLSQKLSDDAKKSIDAIKAKG